MRICHFVHRYYPGFGGAELYMGQLSAALAAAGHDVTVVTSDAGAFTRFWDPRQPRLAELEARHDGVRILRFPIAHLPASRLTFPAVRRLQWVLGRAGVPSPWLQRLARGTPRLPTLWQWVNTTDTRFDLVAGMTITLENQVAAAAHLATRQGAPFVCFPLAHLGTGPVPGQDALSRYYTMPHQNALVRGADAVVTLTSAEKAYYVAQGVPAARITVAGGGIDPSALGGGDGDRLRRRLAEQARRRVPADLVLALGAMDAAKGTLHTLAAVRQLWGDGLDVGLLLIGARTAAFDRLVDRLPAADRARVFLLGAVEESVKKDALAACTLLAMPSRTESFGIAYLEAWFYGKPVIGARSWAVADVIADGVDGLLVPYADPDALAAAIRALLDDPDAAARMGAAGRAKALAQFTWDRVVTRVAGVYDALVGSD